MSRHHRTKGIHDTLVYLLFLAALALGAVGLSQCRMVDDTVTGVDLNQSSTMGGKSRCIKRCNEAYKEARQDENHRHRDALKDCDRDRHDGDKGDDGDGKKDDDGDDQGKGDDGKKGDEARDECRKAENDLHRAILKQLESERRECKRNCYNEGSGGGGR